jgi:hypothetical protein
LEDATVVDVYIEQVSFYINRVRGLIGAQPLSPSEPPGLMRAMLSVPQAFYNALHERGTESGSRILRTQGISKGEFRQLEYFFILINLNEHSSLIIVSPLDLLCPVDQLARLINWQTFFRQYVNFDQFINWFPIDI